MSNTTNTGDDEKSLQNQIKLLKLQIEKEKMQQLLNTMRVAKPMPQSNFKPRNHANFKPRNREKPRVQQESKTFKPVFSLTEKPNGLYIVYKIYVHSNIGVFKGFFPVKKDYSNDIHKFNDDLVKCTQATEVGAVLNQYDLFSDLKYFHHHKYFMMTLALARLMLLTDDDIQSEIMTCICGVHKYWEVMCASTNRTRQKMGIEILMKKYGFWVEETNEYSEGDDADVDDIEEDEIEVINEDEN